jgi:hypothetical protein
VTRPTAAVTAYFRTRFLCRDLQMRPDTGPITVRYPSQADQVTLTFMPVEPVPGQPGHTMEAIVWTKRSVPGRPGRDLQILAEQRLPPGSRVEPGALADPEIWDIYFEHGCPPLDVLPEHLDALFTEMQSLHRAAAGRTVQLLRWRHGFEVPTQPFAQRTDEWSLDQETWWRISIRGRGYVQVSLYDLGPSAITRISEVQRLLDADDEMPVGHELLTEAQEQAHLSLRSALVLSLAALEVGFKGLIGELVPAATWLAAELPSPPLEKMLRHYLPLLPKALEVSAGLGDRLNDDVLVQVRKAVELRNNLVHKGKAKIDFRWLHSWMDLCRDLLYLFDFYQGHSWALQEIEGPPGRLGELLRQGDRRVPMA